MKIGIHSLGANYAKKIDPNAQRDGGYNINVKFSTNITTNFIVL